MSSSICWLTDKPSDLKRAARGLLTALETYNGLTRLRTGTALCIYANITKSLFVWLVERANPRNYRFEIKNSVLEKLSILR